MENRPSSARKKEQILHPFRDASLSPSMSWKGISLYRLPFSSSRQVQNGAAVLASLKGLKSRKSRERMNSELMSWHFWQRDVEGSIWEKEHLSPSETVINLSILARTMRLSKSIEAFNGGILKRARGLVCALVRLVGLADLRWATLPHTSKEATLTDEMKWRLARRRQQPVFGSLIVVLIEREESN